MLKNKNNYLQELKSFDLEDMPSQLPKGALILRILFVGFTVGVAALLFYYIITTLLLVANTFSPEVFGAELGLP